MSKSYISCSGNAGTPSGGIDGLWANTVKDVAIVAGVDTYQLSARTFRDVTGQDLGDKAFSHYAMAMYGGWWTRSSSISRSDGRGGVQLSPLS